MVLYYKIVFGRIIFVILLMFVNILLTLQKKQLRYRIEENNTKANYFARIK